MPRRTDAEIEVLHHDRDLFVVQKPSGLPTTSPDGGDCLAARVRALDPRAPRCHPSSRLDADVTGVVVFARSDRGIALVSEARSAGRYARRYVALTIAGAPGTSLGGDDTATWTWPIAIDPRDPRKRRALDPGQRGERTQEAMTHARVLARAPLALSLLLEPVTGRTHQLRVHAARAGLPLLGDATYGGPRRLVAPDGRVLSCPRVALHCLVVVLPTRGDELLAFVAPIPEDLAGMAADVGLPPIDARTIANEARDSLAR